MAELAWQYDYFDLVGVGGRIVRRPLVPLSIGRVERGERSEFTLGLIDSGAEYTLADWTLADELGLDPTAEVEDDVVRIAVGGRAHDVHLAQVELSLYAAPAIGGDPRSESWLADVGFIRDWPAAEFKVLLGHRGFFDQWQVHFAARELSFTVASYPGA